MRRPLVEQLADATPQELDAAIALLEDRCRHDWIERAADEPGRFFYQCDRCGLTILPCQDPDQVAP